MYYFLTLHHCILAWLPCKMTGLMIAWMLDKGLTTEVVPSPTSWSWRSANSTNIFADGCSTSNNFRIVAPSFVTVTSWQRKNELLSSFFRSDSTGYAFLSVFHNKIMFNMYMYELNHSPTDSPKSATIWHVCMNLISLSQTSPKSATIYTLYVST